MNQLYFEDFESGFNYNVSGVGDAGRKTEGAITGSYSGYVAENPVTADSPAFVATTTDLTLNYDARMGDNSIINEPEGGENLEVYYLNDVGSWVLVDTHNPDNWVAGEIRSFSHSLGADAQHAALQIRFASTGGSGNNFDYWWFDNVEVTSTDPVVIPDGSVELNWTDNSGSESGFPIYRSTTSSPSFPDDYTKIYTAPANTTSYTDTAAPQNSVVWYAVTAIVDSGIETAPTTESITTTSGPTNQSASLDAGSVTVSGLSPGASTPTQATGDVTRGLVSKWKFDGDLTDSVGSNNATGSVSYAPGVIDQAAQFNGTNAASAADDPSMDTAEFSVGFHAYPVATSSGTNAIHVYANKDNGYQDRMFWIVQWDGIWQARVGSNAVTVQGPAVVPNEWVHVMLTYDGSTFTLYIDGTSVGSNTENTLDGDSANLMFGAEEIGKRHAPNGTLIDEGRFHNVCLDATEVADVAAYDGTAPVQAQSATLETAWPTLFPQPLSGIGGPVTAGFGPVSASVAGSGPGASPGAVGAVTEAASAAVSGASPAASPGSTATTVSPATAAVAGAGPAAVPGSVGAELPGSQASLSAFDISSGVAPLSAGLEAGGMASMAGPVLATPGPVAATATAATASVGASSPSAVPGAVGGTVAPAAGTLTPLSVSGVAQAPGAVSATLAASPSILTAIDPAAVAGPTAGTVEAVSATAVGVGPAAVGGPVSSEVEAGALVSAGSEFAVTVDFSAEVVGGVLDVGAASPGAFPGAVSADVLAGVLSVYGSDTAGVPGLIAAGLDSGAFSVVGTEFGALVITTYGKIVALVGVRDLDRELSGVRDVEHELAGSRRFEYNFIGEK